MDKMIDSAASKCGRAKCILIIVSRPYATPFISFFCAEKSNDSYHTAVIDLMEVNQIDTSYDELRNLLV